MNFTRDTGCLLGGVAVVAGLTLLSPANVALAVVGGGSLVLLGWKHLHARHEKRTLEAQAKALDERYRLLTDNLAAAVVLRDERGKLVYCSPYSEVLTGYAVAEMLDHEGDFFRSIISSVDQERYDRALKVVACGEAFQFRFRFMHKTGLEMWGETRSVPVLDAQGNVTASLSVTLDVTASVRYQQQVEERNRDLQDFTYMITHDLKAPIFTMKGMLGVLEEDYAPTLPPSFSEAVQHLRGATQRLEQLASGIIEYSRVNAQETSNVPLALATIVEQVQRDFSPTLEKVHGCFTIEAELPTVLGDELMVYQILSNLVGNAIKYRAPDRRLELRLSTEPSTNARYLTLTLSDNGLGIPSDKVPTLFRPFQRAHPHIEGSGIGLACVRKLFEKIGGEVRVISEEGRGSTFYLTFLRPL